ncbi:TPA: hypothetical protein ITS68_002486 [Enterococcus faecalis]|uniref:hypothetical protein n=1 Tax=Enterococcus TaxID=1350 RepID=UPI001144C905|nr:MULTISPECIES: hypothetical protein [Enterococcus]MCL4596032.1 hypothetical protein [Enterococcus faecalis]MDB1685332.1 hypothetical protein [Enterococcus durans]TQB60943.1 hypothetical protein FKZ15_14160 [Enterococcus faecalis]HAP2865530.1 hypothetical protein [Enterococcus faecalis]HAP3008375.1 hypothetical protein [Enterococcus faecalis]
MEKINLYISKNNQKYFENESVNKKISKVINDSIPEIYQSVVTQNEVDLPKQVRINLAKLPLEVQQVISKKKQQNPSLSFPDIVHELLTSSLLETENGVEKRLTERIEMSEENQLFYLKNISEQVNQFITILEKE